VNILFICPASSEVVFRGRQGLNRFQHDYRDIKNQIDRIWDAFWSGGISNSLEVIEQITYLLFIRRLDDIQTLEEKNPTG
jgi:hypothetical protein